METLNNSENKKEIKDYSIFELAFNKKVIIYFRKTRGSNSCVKGILKKIQGDFLLLDDTWIIPIDNVSYLEILKK